MRDRFNNKSNSNGKYKILLLLTMIVFIAIFGTKSTIISYVKNIVHPSQEDLKNSLRDIIINDPEFFVQSFKIAQQNEIEKMKLKMQEQIVKNKSKLESGSYTPTAGNAEGTIAITYFFDYTCGHCKTANAVINNILLTNKDVILYYKELPILGKKSMEYAKAALAVYKIDKNKYPSFHDALMSENASDTSFLKKTLKSLNISQSEFDYAFKSKEIEEMLFETNKLAAEIGLSGTPAIIVGNEILPGYDESAINKKIIELRKNNEDVTKNDESK